MLLESRQSIEILFTCKYLTYLLVNIVNTEHMYLLVYILRFGNSRPKLARLQTVKPRKLKRYFTWGSIQWGFGACTFLLDLSKGDDAVRKVISKTSPLHVERFLSKLSRNNVALNWRFPVSWSTLKQIRWKINFARAPLSLHAIESKTVCAASPR
jgi:hypothetical protein